MSLQADSDDNASVKGAADRALSKIADARRHGAASAAELAEELIGGHAGQGIRGGTTNRPHPPSAVRSTWHAVEVALEGALDALRDATKQLDGLLMSDAPHRVGIESLDIEARVLVETRTEIWIHNQTAAPSTPLELRLTDLTNRAGLTLDAKASFEPSSLPSLDHGASTGSVLCVTPSATAERGEYHGLVLITGAGRLEPLHVRLVVRDDP